MFWTKFQYHFHQILYFNKLFLQFCCSNKYTSDEEASSIISDSVPSGDNLSPPRQELLTTAGVQSILPPHPLDQLEDVSNILSDWQESQEKRKKLQADYDILLVCCLNITEGFYVIKCLPPIRAGVDLQKIAIGSWKGSTIFDRSQICAIAIFKKNFDQKQEISWEKTFQINKPRSNPEGSCNHVIHEKL